MTLCYYPPWSGQEHQFVCGFNCKAFYIRLVNKYTFGVFRLNKSACLFLITACYDFINKMCLLMNCAIPSFLDLIIPCKIT